MQTGTGIDAAISALQAGDLVLAENLCAQARQANPFDASVVDVLAMIQLQKGDARTALATINNAISIEANQALFYSHLGIIRKALGQLEESRQAYEKALELEPNAPDILYNLAILKREMGDLEDSLTLSLKAANLGTEDSAVFNNLGAVYQDLGRFEEAAEAYRQALKLNPGHMGATGNLAAVLAEGDQVNEALEICAGALAQWRDHPEILNAQSNAFMKAQRWVDAVGAADTAIENAPEFAQAHYGKSLALLTQGNFEEGLPEFEWRVRRSNFWPQRQYGQPLWTGEPLAGKTLLVHWEQGFGDILQFARYIPLIKDLESPPATIIFDCPTKLVELFKDTPGVDVIGDFGDSPPTFDAYVPLMSLPHRFGTNLETIPADTPYISNTLTDYFTVPDLPDTCLKVGIVWASDHGTSYRRKVCPLDEIAPLFELNTIAFYGLQFGADARELEAHTSRKNVVNLADDLGDFAHTAAVAQQMDLILSIDTYIVHLAGAMNIPVWIILPYTPDWRWFLDRADSPWYPSARLFRQQAPGDWPSVINAIHPDLDALAGNAK